MASSLALDPRGRVVSRTNLVSNPQLGTNATDWAVGSYGPGGVGTAGRVNLSLTFGWWFQATWTTAPSDAGTSLLNFAVGKTPIVPGVAYSARVFGRVTWGGAQTAARIYWYNAAGVYLGGGPVGPTALHAASAGEWRTASGVAPAAAAFGRVDFIYVSGSLPTAGRSIAATGALVTAGTVLGNYMDGSTPAAGDFTYEWLGTAHASPSVEKITDPDTTSAAIFALGYEVSHPVRTIIHPVLDTATQPVTFRPAGPRSGRIQYLFSEWETCRRAEIIHTRPGYVILDDVDWPASPMRYVAQGDVVVRLDPDTRTRWILETGFQEVPA